MDIKNFILKKKQRKAIKGCDDISIWMALPHHCPKCHFATDNLTDYTTHLENHLKRRFTQI